MLKEFREWLLKHKTVDTLIIGYFLAEALSTFYKDSFKNLFTPIITRVLPGKDEDTVNILGAKINLHSIIVGIFQLILSFYIAFFLRKILYDANKNIN